MTAAVGLAAFEPAIVSDVARDVDAAASAVKVCYLVDPHEVVGYCFPLGIFPEDERLVVDEHRLAEISDTQNALYSVLHNWPQRPLLVSEYSHELSRIENYIRWQASQVYGQMEIIRRLLQPGRSVDPPDGKTEDLLVALVEKEFNVALAVASGMYSLGVDRLSELYRTRLMQVDDLDSVMVRQALDEYAPSPLVELIFDRLQSTYTRSDDELAIRKRRNRGFLTDARAIDKVLALNKWFCDSARLSNGLPEYLFLYVSSASRTGVVFAMPEVRAELPVVKNAVYPIWRKRNHLFAYVVHKRQSHFHTGRALAKTFRLMQEASNPGPSVSGRRRGESVPLVRRLILGSDVLPSIEETIAPMRAAMGNLNLGVNVEEYRRLYERSQSIVPGMPADARVRECLKLFADVFEKVGFRDLALDRMRSLNELMSMMSDPGPAAVMAAEGELITVPVQRLPTKPRFAEPEYASIFEDIRAFFVTPYSRRHTRQTQLRRAYHRFDSIERATSATVRSPEHELVRCFLYLAFQGEDGDERAFDTAMTQIDRDSGIDAEFYYVACWAARRKGWLDFADAIGQHGRDLFPRDGRFPHGLALNVFSGVGKKPRWAGASLAKASQYAQEAIKLYVMESETKNADVIAANLHNVAYFATINPRDDAFDVDVGRRAIDALKKTIDPETWTPDYPEYHHGEALLEYREYQRKLRAREPTHELCRKLQWAKGSIDEAMRGYPKNIYITLARDIERAIARHHCEISSRLVGDGST